MKQKRTEFLPSLIITHEDGSETEIFITDQDEWFPWNSSTNYDHQAEGPSAFMVKDNRRDKTELYVDDPKVWNWVQAFIDLACEHLNEINNEEWQERLKKAEDKIKNAKPYKSFHEVL